MTSFDVRLVVVPTVTIGDMAVVLVLGLIVIALATQFIFTVLSRAIWRKAAAPPTRGGEQ